MIVGICTIEIHLPGAHSLKEKRRVLRSLKDRLRSKHNISIAEVDDQDLWQKAVIGLAAVSIGRVPLERLFEAIRSEVRSQISGEIIEFQIDYV